MTRETVGQGGIVWWPDSGGHTFGEASGTGKATVADGVCQTVVNRN